MRARRFEPRSMPFSLSGEKISRQRNACRHRHQIDGKFGVDGSTPHADALIGTWLPAWRPRAKVKEVALPKFYWFDAGVLHAAAGGFDQPLTADWDGVLLEHLVHHELRSHIHYAAVKGSLGYWATPSGSEVDFVWWHGRNVVAIEVKNGREFRRDWKKGIDALRAGTTAKAYVVYRGDRELEVDGARVLPLDIFLRRLHAGEIVG
jgi:uncharacterized protein